MFENDEGIKESFHGEFTYHKKELRVCLFLHKVTVDNYNPLAQMNTIAFMLGVPASNEIRGMITLKNPAKPPTSYKTWTISAIDANESKVKFRERFWHYWEEAKEKILDLHGENISIIYEGRFLDGGGYN